MLTHLRLKACKNNVINSKRFHVPWLVLTKWSHSSGVKSSRIASVIFTQGYLMMFTLCEYIFYKLNQHFPLNFITSGQPIYVGPASGVVTYFPLKSTFTHTQRQISIPFQQSQNIRNVKCKARHHVWTKVFIAFPLMFPSLPCLAFEESESKL